MDHFGAPWLTRLRHLLVACGCSAVLAAVPAHAATLLTPSFSATAVEPLQFGTIVTSGGGTVTIAPNGSISDNGVVPVSGNPGAPAEFMLSYSKAQLDLLTYQLIFQITLQTTAAESSGQVQGTLSGLTTDLPGYSAISPGQTLTYTLPYCANPTCTVTFHIGGTLNVTSGGGGAVLTFPLAVMASVTAVLE